VTYTVEFYTGEEWRETMWAMLPGPELSEAERLAERRSSNGLVYRVRKDKQTLSRFQHGKQLTKEDA
jgi:hypothetical protein